MSSNMSASAPRVTVAALPSRIHCAENSDDIVKQQRRTETDETYSNIFRYYGSMMVAAVSMHPLHNVSKSCWTPASQKISVSKETFNYLRSNSHTCTAVVDNN